MNRVITSLGDFWRGVSTLVRGGILLVFFLLAWTVLAVVWVLATRVPERPVMMVLPSATSTPVVEAPRESNLPIVAVMVDMHRDAHPVSGVDRAAVVYEAPVEGGINRLLAVFNVHQPIEEVGPVRSARPYFIDIASEYGAMYMHVGGSPEATKQLRRRDDVVNLDQWYNSQFYWFDRRRAAPHHVYTSSSHWLAAVQEREVASSTFGLWRIAADEPVGWQPAPEIVIASVNNGSPVWRWDGTINNVYVRLSGKDPYHTRAGDQIMVSTIIVQQVAQRVLDSEGRLSLDLKNGGFAWIFRDGVMNRGFWRYSEKENRTRWYDDNGEEIALKSPGVWVHVVPQNVEPRPVISPPARL